MEIYITCFVVALIGIAFQILFKIRSLKEKAVAGNATFNWKDYFKNDWIALLASFGAVILAEFFIRDALDYFQVHPNSFFIPLLKLTFVTLGYAGADILYRLLGRSSAMINKIIDIKTNELDYIKKQ